MRATRSLARTVRRSTYRSAWIAALGSEMGTLPKKSPSPHGTMCSDFRASSFETIQGIVMTVCDFYALTEQGFVYVGRAFGYDFDDAVEGDGAWPLDLTGDGRSELVTRSTFGDGMSCVFVYRWNVADGNSQYSKVDWEKADAQLARLSAPLGMTARAETYHAQDNTVTLTLYTESGTKETTLPLTTDILGEWFADD